MLKRTNKFRHVIISEKCDTPRFMTLDVNVCRNASWLESLGALTLGAVIVPTVTNPHCNGLRGDLEALGKDYNRVGKRVMSADDFGTSTIRRSAAVAR